jgi:hypothetical protein
VLLLSLDPGLTTGWAILDEAGAIVATGTIDHHDVRIALIRILREQKLDHAVLETVPLEAPGHLADSLRHVLATLGGMLTTYQVEMTYILPGVWKTSSVPQPEARWAGKRLSIHQRDAIRMGRYYLRKHA